MNIDARNQMHPDANEEDRQLLSEYMIFCQYADTFDFNNYFRLDELTESELMSIFDFLYHEDCFLMMQNLLNKYNRKLFYFEKSFLETTCIRNDFQDRLDKLVTYENA
ncbi:MAG: hypothetical protein HFI75_00340 [Lachnospiraceae bacterium]|nr:hypothetical protein [Lachnospiraceae bacterium]